MGIGRSRAAKYQAQGRFFIPISVLYFLTKWRSLPKLKLEKFLL